MANAILYDSCIIISESSYFDQLVVAVGVMSYFLLQQRHLRPVDKGQPTFPASLTTNIRFGPSDAFGVPATGPRTTGKRAAPAVLRWNANEGTSTWEGDLIEKIQAELKIGPVSASWSGDVLQLAVGVTSFNASEQVISSVSHLLPAFLSLRLRVFVWIQEFIANIGGVNYRLETATHRYGITLATTDHNAEGAMQSIHAWSAQRPEGLHAVMALYYYRQAMRLASLEPDRQSMAAEVILNLAKAIEIIFSSNRDQLRSRAAEWGFDGQFIERWIVPILLIRNELDVAHVASAPLKLTEHQAVLDFLDRAFVQVHTLLERVLELNQAESLALDPPSESLDADKRKLLRSIEAYATMP